MLLHIRLITGFFRRHFHRPLIPAATQTFRTYGNYPAPCPSPSLAVAPISAPTSPAPYRQVVYAVPTLGKLRPGLEAPRSGYGPDFCRPLGLTPPHTGPAVVESEAFNHGQEGFSYTSTPVSALPFSDLHPHQPDDTRAAAGPSTAQFLKLKPHRLSSDPHEAVLYNDIHEYSIYLAVLPIAFGDSGHPSPRHPPRPDDDNARYIWVHRKENQDEGSFSFHLLSPTKPTLKWTPLLETIDWHHQRGHPVTFQQPPPAGQEWFINTSRSFPGVAKLVPGTAAYEEAMKPKPVPREPWWDRNTTRISRYIDWQPGWPLPEVYEREMVTVDRWEGVWNVPALVTCCRSYSPVGLGHEGIVYSLGRIYKLASFKELETVSV
ncbi:hypothetical protein BJ508DRAFT_312637 [Ascobolus immersus RN42]|uniref:Uncharacterized protein n=1 Tax=Ascobolus immersus RN42 TaxID=1160509 RepID=A0A3N4HLH1_ASCIM|nr:hypothetical protein BJ508DRAFT_312637 [Ascobolus immersus RN42]